MEGGGLAIYSHVPDLEQPTSAVNREYANADDEERLRSQARSPRARRPPAAPGQLAAAGRNRRPGRGRRIRRTTGRARPLASGEPAAAAGAAETARRKDRGQNG